MSRQQLADCLTKSLAGNASWRGQRYSVTVASAAATVCLTGAKAGNTHSPLGVLRVIDCSADNIVPGINCSVSHTRLKSCSVQYYHSADDVALQSVAVTLQVCCSARHNLFSERIFQVLWPSATPNRYFGRSLFNKTVTDPDWLQQCHLARSLRC
jgi:hypothetical protein